MSYTKADIDRLLKSNPDLAHENTALDIAQSALSADVRKLNPETASDVTRPVDGADTLLGHIRVLAPDLYPLLTRDYPFQSFKIDLAAVPQKIAIEVDGGQWQPGGGKHGSRRDYQKTRQITMAGWLLLRFTTSEVNDDPIGVIGEIRSAVCKS